MNLPNELVAKMPHIKRSKLEKYWNTYIRVLTKHFAQQTMIKRGVLRLPLLSIRKEMGQYRINGDRGSLYRLMHDAYPFFVVLQLGNNAIKKINEVGILRSKEKDVALMIANARASDILEIAYRGMTFDEIDNLDTVPVNTKSLRDLVRSTHSQLQNAETKKQQSELTNYINYAEKILKVIKALDDVDLLEIGSNDDTVLFPYRSERSNFGREYHKGVNLQNAPKVVREAALGDCHAYDINSAVITIKLHLFQGIMKKKGKSMHGVCDRTKEYVQSKDQVRERLAGLLSPDKDNVKLIKQLVTSISFDAPLSEGAWPVGNYIQHSSFIQIIHNPQERQDLRDDGWLIEFSDEQRHMTKLIIEHVESEMPHLMPYNLPDEKVKTATGRWKKPVLMSYIYQKLESQFMDMVKDQFGDHMTLIVHDGFYSSKNISLDDLRVITQMFTMMIGHNDCSQYEIQFGSERINSYEVDLIAPDEDAPGESREPFISFNLLTTPIFNV